MAENTKLSRHIGIHEPVCHGGPDFHLMIHTFTARDPVRPHWHGEYEILMFTQGQGTMQINADRFPFSEGTIVFVRSEAVHGITPGEKTPCAFFAVCFGQELIDSAGEDAIRRKYITPVQEGTLLFPSCIRRGDPLWEPLRVPLLEIQRAGAEGFAGRELLVKSDLLRIWYLLVSNPAPAGKTADPQDGQFLLLRQILLRLQARYAEDVTLSMLSAEFHMSEGQLCRIFRRGTGMSVISYLNYYRITIACSMLREGEAPVGSIAASVGFRNISYFNRIFRRFVHCTPAEYRKSPIAPDLADPSSHLQPRA